jgi:hypothetical protein
VCLIYGNIFTLHVYDKIICNFESYILLLFEKKMKRVLELLAYKSARSLGVDLCHRIQSLSLGFKTWQELWIILYEQTIQVAYEKSMIPLWFSAHAWNKRKGHARSSSTSKPGQSPCDIYSVGLWPKIQETKQTNEVPMS